MTKERGRPGQDSLAFRKIGDGMQSIGLGAAAMIED
jgi:hypothetical protein